MAVNCFSAFSLQLVGKISPQLALWFYSLVEQSLQANYLTCLILSLFSFKNEIIIHLSHLVIMKIKWEGNIYIAWIINVPDNYLFMGMCVSEYDSHSLWWMYSLHHYW